MMRKMRRAKGGYTSSILRGTTVSRRYNRWLKMREKETTRSSHES
jgi:hypothetical protein